MRIPARFAVLALLAAPAAALSPELAAWGEGPASFLMTADERAEWGRLADDAAARAFVERFWSRRDPTPATPDNEARLEFQKRVAWAERYLSTPGRSGAMSDRGRVLIVLGPPSAVQRSRGPAAGGAWRETENLAIVHHSPGDILKGQGGIPPDLSGNPFTDADAATPAARETWIYEKERAPKTTGRRLIVRFQRAPGTGVPQLAQPRKIFELLAAEAEAARPR
jgi:GWxTD domain-containing protein